MKRAPRIAIVVSILTLVASVLGFVATLVLNTFVLDEYNAYGEVPIPGSTTLQLPAGRDDREFPYGDHGQADERISDSRPEFRYHPDRRAAGADGHRKHRRDNVGQQRHTSADLDGSDSASRYL